MDRGGVHCQLSVQRAVLRPAFLAFSPPFLSSLSLIIRLYMLFL